MSILSSAIFCSFTNDCFAVCCCRALMEKERSAFWHACYNIFVLVNLNWRMTEFAQTSEPNIYAMSASDVLKTTLQLKYKAFFFGKFSKIEKEIDQQPSSIYFNCKQSHGLSICEHFTTLKWRYNLLSKAIQHTTHKHCAAISQLCLRKLKILNYYTNWRYLVSSSYFSVS